MSATASDIILHHYRSSPFSEKIRLAFGLKGLAWYGVEIPAIMPRPDLMPLTGGYRRTPVMQIGADIYCDTQCILRELERRYPTPSLTPSGGPGLASALALWTDRPFFQASAALMFGALGDAVPADFIKDREALTGQKINVSAMTAALPHLAEQWRAHAGWLEETLADGRRFLDGRAASLLDVHAYMNIWFARMGSPRAADILEALPHVTAWAGRIAAVGHGRGQALDSKAALAIARDSESTTRESKDAGEPNGLAPGRSVTVMPDDYGRVPVSGTLVCSNAHMIAIRRRDPAAGAVVIHFPRVGFVVNPTP